MDGVRRFVHDDVAAARDGRSDALHLFFLPADLLSLSAGRHLIAVRYASANAQRARRIGFFGGFTLSFTRAAEGLPYWEAHGRYAFNLNFLFVGATGALALLHLLLFAFYRGRRENLFFGLAGWGCVGISVGTLFFSLADDLSTFMVGIYLFSGSIVFASLFLLRHAYEVFLGRVPRYYWGMVVVGVAVGAGTWYLPRFGVYIFCGLAFAEMLRVLTVGLVRRVDGAWIIGAGGGIAVACTALTILGDLRLLWLPNMLYLYGFLVMMVSLSIHLARGFAKDKRDLEAQLARNDELAAEALAQQERAHAERRAALGELLAGVAHEINSPLGALTSVSEVSARCGQKIDAVLQDAPSLERAREHPRLRKALKVLEQSGAAATEAAQRITGLVGSLAEFTGLDKAELRRVDLQQGIESALTLLLPRMEGRISVERDYGELPPILCYASELNQVFAGLVQNACDAIEGPGTIRIVTSCEGGLARVAFCDDGPGMSEAQLETLFDFRISREGGRRARMGLGLKVAQAVMDKHGGAIHARRNEGPGMTFRLELPLDGSPLAEVASAEPNA